MGKNPFAEACWLCEQLVANSVRDNEPVACSIRLSIFLGLLFGIVTQRVP